jgi:TolA-binding protein
MKLLLKQLGCLVLLIVLVGAVVRSVAQEPARPAVKPPATPADQAFSAAEQAMKKSDFTTGRKLFGEFVGKFPGDARVPEAHFLKGLCEQKGGPAGAALSTWNALVALHPKSDSAAKALEQMALHYEKEKASARADEMMNRLLGTFPTNAATVRLWSKRGDALFEAKKYDEAVKAWEAIEASLAPSARQQLAVARVLAKGKSDPRSLLEAANTSLERNEVALAIGLYQAYLERFPNGADIRQAKTQLGWCYYLREQDKDIDQAESLWKEVAQQGPANDEWVGESQWHLVQILAGARGKWEQAAALCETIAKNFPKGSFRHEQALFSRAWLFWAQREWQKSKTAFDALIAAYPEKTNHPPIVEYIEQCDKNLAAGKIRGK